MRLLSLTWALTPKSDKSNRLTREGNGNGTKASQKFRNGGDRLGLRARSCSGRGPNPASVRSIATSSSAQPAQTAPLPPTGAGRLTPGPSLVAGWNPENCSKILYEKGGNLVYIAYNTDNTLLYALIPSNSGNDGLSTIQSQLLAACKHGGYYVHITPSLSSFDAIAIVYP